jgi:hypothetical protein
MKYVILALLVFTLGCNKKSYTNDECVTAVGHELKFEQADRQTRAMAELVASEECTKQGNDPKKTVESLTK